MRCIKDVKRIAFSLILCCIPIAQSKIKDICFIKHTITSFGINIAFYILKSQIPSLMVYE